MSACRCWIVDVGFRIADLMRWNVGPLIAIQVRDPRSAIRHPQPTAIVRSPKVAQRQMHLVSGQSLGPFGPRCL